MIRIPGDIIILKILEIVIKDEESYQDDEFDHT